MAVTSLTALGTGGFWPTNNIVTVGTCGSFLEDLERTTAWRLLPSDDPAIVRRNFQMLNLMMDKLQRWAAEHDERLLDGDL